MTPLFPVVHPHVEAAFAVAEMFGVGVFSTQHPEFAPEADRALDVCVVVLRGQEAVELGREALEAVAKLVEQRLKS